MEEDMNAKEIFEKVTGVHLVRPIHEPLTELQQKFAPIIEHENVDPNGVRTNFATTHRVDGHREALTKGQGSTPY